ncbi:hypothetical protein AVEN_191173-1 [Araneus ventricosus]|uniref:Uncharacterized protein n=1 Tax=Araneus ventricosus TaxID=182803 RepID=A0A4Y2B0W6_ARAVE|nr:hypothetical protein AVEN_191173-1 [Araneus ventricosus]
MHASLPNEKKISQVSVGAIFSFHYPGESAELFSFTASSDSPGMPASLTKSCNAPLFATLYKTTESMDAEEELSHPSVHKTSIEVQKFVERIETRTACTKRVLYRRVLFAVKKERKSQIKPAGVASPKLSRMLLKNVSFSLPLRG